jgi:hypothetical protein
MLETDKRFSHISASIEPPRIGKDYNEALLHEIKQEREQKQTKRRETAFSL